MNSINGHRCLLSHALSRGVFILMALFIFAPFFTFAQEEDLEKLLEKEIEKKSDFTIATFKATRLINGQTIERMQKGDLDVRISHRFGNVNSGAYEFFGIDQSSTFLSLEYGITDWLMAGIGRATFQKTFNGFCKLSFLRQCSGKQNMPVSVSLFEGVSCNGLKWPDTERSNYFESRLSFTHQILIARKVNSKISLQLSPALVHRNLVKYKNENNDLYAMGLGGRYKFTNRFAITAEYFYVYGLINSGPLKYYNPLSVGFDIETGSHVFQVHVTNSCAMTENGFIGETTGNFFDGDIRIGFNISRVFTLKNKKKEPSLIIQ